jgi:predicted negative regulator of RcsB-dependent stress response
MNIKNLLIVAVIAVLIIFGYKWFDGYGFKFGESERRVEELEAQIKQLEQDKTESDTKILTWQNKHDSIQKKEVALKTKVSMLAKETIAAESQAAKSKAELEDVKNRTVKTRDSIRTIKRTPVNRRGQELVQSLKNKLK